MADNTTPSVKAEAGKTLAILKANVEDAKLDNIKVDNAKVDNVKVDSPKVETAKVEPATTTPETNGNHPTTVAIPTKTQAEAPKEIDKSTTNSSAPVKKPFRSPLSLDAATEDHVRDLMAKARKAANGGENSFKSDEEVYDLALLANDFVQLMNAAYIATDTIVRGVSYMQGGSNPNAKTALSVARRDRREQKEAEQALGDATNLVPAEAGTTSPATADVVGNTQATKTTHTAAVAADTVLNKENTGHATQGQQQKSESGQNKSRKGKKQWKPRNNFRQRKDSAAAKTQDGKARGQTNGVTETKTTIAEKETLKEDKPVIAEEKTTVKEHKPETSGSDTAVEEPILGEVAAVAVMV